MTKEELKQEAEEYVKQNYCEMCVMADDCKSGCIDCFTVQAYIVSAETREKRIEELQHKIDILQGYLDRDVEYQELQKENAELKEQISIKDILIKELQDQKVYWKESSFDWRHKFFKLDKVKRLIKKDKELAKAKDLLKWALHSDPEHDEDFEKKWEEAKQFLNSEVEK